MSITKQTVKQAHNGDKVSQNHVAVRVREELQDRGVETGWIDFDALTLELDDSKVFARERGGCDCYCSSCSQGWHCHDRNKSCDE